MNEQPDWVREALAAAEARDAQQAALQHDREAQEVADDRHRLERQLERCGVPLERATLTYQREIEQWYAAVDGHLFTYQNRGLVRLIPCPACARLLPTVHSAQVLGADMGALLRAEQVEYHRCYGRPTTDADFDENGDLLPDCDDCRAIRMLCSMHYQRRSQPMPQPPSTREALLLALDAYVEERLAGSLRDD
jgi:hypothetical protein